MATKHPRRRSDNGNGSPSKFGWATHPLGIFAKITIWWAGQHLADQRGCRVVQVPRNTLWDEVVSRLPYLPTIWADATGRPLTPGIVANRLYYMFRTHQPGGGPGALI